MPLRSEVIRVFVTSITASLSFFLFLLAAATAQPQSRLPLPELPRTLIDTAYQRPKGATIKVRAGEDLQAALDKARPGETIVIEAGATFTGNFDLQPKSGEGWIYIESAGIENRLRPGQRSSPAEAQYMAKIRSANSQSPISVLPGAANYRLVGLEVTPAEGAPRIYNLVNIDFLTSRVEAKVRNMVLGVAPKLVQEPDFPKNIIIDRCYIHGSDTQDVREGIVANGIAVAVIDSHISDIHDSTMDSQAVLAYRTLGPIKIVNNLLSATTEDVMFGGAGGVNNTYIPSDIEIRNNHFFKPLSWLRAGVTLPPHNRWVVKNNLEFKEGRRAIVTGNVLENNWLSGQIGYSVVLTVRTGDSGNTAVVDDITIENNVLKNVPSGFNTLEHDDGCAGVSGCTNTGETRRVRIANNLILFLDPNGPGGVRNWGIALSDEMTDLVFEHNTLVPFPGTNCDQSVYFEGAPGSKWPPARSYTRNIWILDNVLCRQPTGDWGGRGQGTAGLVYYMGDPPPLNERFFGNVILFPAGDPMPSFPPKNSLQTKIAFVDAAAGNYQLASPKWTQTSDGALAGVDMAALEAAVAGAVPPVPDAKTAPPATSAH
jgi:hypothetical protein